MDFSTLLYVAKKNSESNKNDGKYYSTKYAPPKKVSKEKKLSDNIQKFLQKKEQEERQKQLEEKQKLANLLAMRDEKSKNKIRKMLKVTKSANKSVLEDAVNSDHTAVTMNGPDQPDQDDYGYVSTEANAFYQKYIEKVKDVKEDKGFAPSRPQSLKDLSGTKERVKAAITKEIEDKRNPTRHRIAHGPNSNATARAPSSASKNLYDPEAERREEERQRREEQSKKAKQRKPAPPPMDFQALLKLAEKKQHEPVDVLPEVKKKKEPERLLTSKEKKELEEQRRLREARERRDKERRDGPAAARMEPNGRIPKLNQSPTKASPNGSLSTAAKPATSTTNGAPKKPLPNGSTTKPPSGTAKPTSSSANGKPTSAATATVKASPKAAATSALPAATSKNPYANVPKNPTTSREFPPRDLKSIKPRQFPPADTQKTRQFPPPDVRRGAGDRRTASNDNRRPPAGSKRRIIDDDEDEYDSELDDFIDDGDCEEDYSSHIKAIFGYDKSRYRDMDDDDDAAMESNFAQVQREEYISKKLGIQEDLEDMKLEAIEKKRKMQMKKRRL